MSMYDLFQTDTSLETKGVYQDYGTFRVLLARAGGSNKKFERELEAKVKPFKRAIQTDTMDDEVAKKLFQDVFAKTVVLGWEVAVDAKGKPVPRSYDGEVTWASGMHGKNNDIIPFNVENTVATFKALPELFNDLKAQSEKFSLYRQSVLEEDVKN